MLTKAFSVESLLSSTAWDPLEKPGLSIHDSTLFSLASHNFLNDRWVKLGIFKVLF